MPRLGTKVACKETAVYSSPITSSERRWTKNNPLSATACMTCSQFKIRHSATRSFFAENFRLPDTAMAAGLLFTRLSHAHSCVLPRLLDDPVPNSGQINRISSKTHFAVANY